MNLECAYCADCAQNAVGEKIAYCELWKEWKNITIGDCFGNCEAQKSLADELKEEA